MNLDQDRLSQQLACSCRVPYSNLPVYFVSLTHTIYINELIILPLRNITYSKIFSRIYIVSLTYNFKKITLLFYFNEV